MAHERAEPADIVGGAEGSSEQTVGMELLKPLTVKNIALTTRNALKVVRVHQQYFEASFFENLHQRNPIDPRRLHHHGLDAAGSEPACQFIEMASKCTEGPDRLCCSIWRHSRVVDLASYINSSCVGMDRQAEILYRPSVSART